MDADGIGGADIKMKAACLAVLLCAAVPLGASAASIELKPGLWKLTDLLRNFEISTDGKKEIENGGSGPNIENVCVTGHIFDNSSLYPGLKIPSVADRCKVSTISETANLIDSVSECTGELATVEHTLVIAPTSKSITIIRETTFTKPLGNGGISRSTSNTSAKWLKESCGH